MALPLPRYLEIPMIGPTCFSLLVRCYMSWTYPGNSWIGGGSTEPQEFALNLPAFDRAFDEAVGVWPWVSGRSGPGSVQKPTNFIQRSCLKWNVDINRLTSERRHSFTSMYVLCVLDVFFQWFFMQRFQHLTTRCCPDIIPCSPLTLLDQFHSHVLHIDQPSSRQRYGRWCYWW